MFDFDFSKMFLELKHHLLETNCNYLSLNKKAQHQCLNSVLQAMALRNMLFAA